MRCSPIRPVAERRIIPQDFLLHRCVSTCIRPTSWAIFIDDMRRLEVACLPPSINHSEAEYSVEAGENGLAVRYALAGIKNVGEKAMEAIVEERLANGAFTSSRRLC
jgi:DNA polymerase III alpha subunit